MIHRGLGYAEMGEQLGVAPGTLRVRVLRCRDRALAERERLASAGGVTPAGVERRSEQP
jgi:DNA-directed RNA polymerase specialized sigma24 family protein